MNGFLKFTLGVAVLGVVGLVGLSVMSIVVALIASQAEPQRVFPRGQAEAEREYAEALAIAGPDHATPPPHPGQLATVLVSVHDSWIDMAGSLVGLSLFIATLAVIFIVIRSMRPRGANNVSDDSALVHELARRAQDLSQRMEALETILLDRTRATR